MEFTGERYVPGVSGAIALEHLQRYVLARELAAGRRVLDIACGEGYGSALLAAGADAVVGVDFDEAAVGHAARAYAPLANVRFAAGRCEAIPLRSGSVDLVVSFETLEHHDRHHEMLAEIKRVLAPGGLLVLSSPNKPVYDAQLAEPNPFHVRELDNGELDTLLHSYFAHVRLWGQMLATGSLVFPMEDGHGEATTPVHALALEDGGLRRRAPVLPAPTYAIAVCRDRPIEPLPVLASLAVDDDLLPAHLRAVRQLKQSGEAETSRADALARDLEAARRQLAHERTVSATLRSQEAALRAAHARALDESRLVLDESRLVLDERQRALDESQRALGAQSQRAEAAETAVAALRATLADAERALDVVRTSRSWRLTAPLRDARGTLARLLHTAGRPRRRTT